MESYQPKHQLVYYKFLKNLNLWRTYSTSGIGLLQEPPFYCIFFFSIENSVRRLLLLKIVLLSLFADAIDGLRPNSAYADPFWLKCGGSICIKKTLFSAQEPKAPVTYCDNALSGVRPSVVRPSSVKLFTFSTSSPEPLDGFWWNLVWLKYSRSLSSVVAFRPDPSRGGSRAGQK